MKKKLLSLVAITVLTTGLSAQSSFQLGYSSNNISSADTEGGFYMGADTFNNIYNHKSMYFSKGDFFSLLIP